MNFKNIFETSEVSKWKYLNLWAKELSPIFLSSLNFYVVSGICFLLSPVHTLSFKNSRSCHYFLLLNLIASQTSILPSHIRFSEQVAWKATCNVGDLGSIPGSGRSPGGGHGNPLHYSRLENPTDRGAWWATVHRVIKSQIWLKWLSMYAQGFRIEWMFGETMLKKYGFLTPDIQKFLKL